MAIYRNVSVMFWNDAKVEEFAPPERYLFLYLLTNSQTRLCGCYEITPRRMAADTGMSEEKVLDLLRSLEAKHNVIRYRFDTHEILILRWYRYNWIRSPKLCRGVQKELPDIKYAPFRSYLRDRLWERFEPELDAAEKAEEAAAAKEDAETAAEAEKAVTAKESAEEIPETSDEAPDFSMQDELRVPEIVMTWEVPEDEEGSSPVFETKLPPKLHFLS